MPPGRCIAYTGPRSTIDHNVNQNKLQLPPPSLTVPPSAPAPEPCPTSIPTFVHGPRATGHPHVLTIHLRHSTVYILDPARPISNEDHRPSDPTVSLMVTGGGSPRDSLTPLPTGRSWVRVATLSRDFLRGDAPSETAQNLPGGFRSRPPPLPQ
jgi:hypothetical protein